MMFSVYDLSVSAVAFMRTFKKAIEEKAQKLEQEILAIVASKIN